MTHDLPLSRPRDLRPGSIRIALGGAMFDSLRDLHDQRRVRRRRTGNTPEKLADDARRARRGAPARYRSSAEPALWAAVAMWLYRSPMR